MVCLQLEHHSTTMKRCQLVLAVAALSQATAGSIALPPSFEADLRAALQPVLDYTANQFNISLSVGVATGDQPFGFGLAAGYDNPGAAVPTPITNRSRFPVGSATKVGALGCKSE